VLWVRVNFIGENNLIRVKTHEFAADSKIAQKLFQIQIDVYYEMLK
jgi:hypothetical protein